MISNRVFIAGTTLIYALVVSFIASFHVVWRDEVVPMSVAAYSTSFTDLCRHIHSFGHPVLWYLVLYLVHQVIHPFWALKVVNILICVAAVAIFLAEAPFNRWQKILFILGFFPLYLYPVFNRNYGIEMLFLFAFAALYPRRFDRMVPLGIVMAFLANTHAHCLLITMAIFLSLAGEFLFFPESRRAWQKHLSGTMIGFALALVGMIYTTIQIIPDHNNIVFSPHALSLHQMMKALIKSIVLPGKAFISVFGIYNALFTSLAVWALYLYLITTPFLLIFFSCSVIALSMFYHLIFQSDEMRHQGVLYLLFVTIFWIESYVPQLRWSALAGQCRDMMARYKEAFFIFLMVLQLCMAFSAIDHELTTTYSSSKSFGAMLTKSPRFKDAVLVGEPGAMLEAVPYYASNRIYLPREGQYKKFTEFTTDQKCSYSLTELLAAAKKVRGETGRSVLIVIGHQLSMQGPFLVPFSHVRSFSYSKESLKDFYQQTNLVATFNKAITDENYRIYLLKQ